jgi:hypothetical protein
VFVFLVFFFSQKDTCVIGTEPVEHAVILYNEPYLVCNAFMASAPQHPYWQQVFSELEQRRGQADPPLSTGPRMLQAALTKYKSQANGASVRVLDSKILYPVYDPYANIPEKCNSVNSNQQRELCSKLSEKNFVNTAWLESFAEHHWAHTWFGGKLDSDVDIGRLVQPYSALFTVCIFLSPLLCHWCCKKYLDPYIFVPRFDFDFPQADIDFEFRFDQMIVVVVVVVIYLFILEYLRNQPAQRSQNQNSAHYSSRVDLGSSSREFG